MNRAWLRALLVAFGTGCAGLPSTAVPEPIVAPFRAPAVPLFVQTPYLHTWLCGDRLADEAPKLWNGQVKGMAGILRINGRAYRFMGLPGSALPAMTQDSVEVAPTRTTFRFSQGDLRLSLEFLSPTDPRDLRLLSLPLGFLRAEISASKPHEVQLYLDVSGEWAVGSSDRRITWDGLFRIRPSQPRLFQETYNYPDWGEFHWVAVDPATSQYGVDQDLRRSFVDGGSPKRDTRFPRAANDEWPTFAHHWDLGKVTTPVVRRAIVGQVRREVVSFLGSACPAYWTREHADAASMLASAALRFNAIRTQLAQVDAEVLARAHAAGGPPLAALASLAFRQAFAANELALHDGRPVYFSKSMDLTGSGGIQSLEAIYPAFPALLAFNRDLLQMQIAPILEALRRGDWREPFAMNNLGAYPEASGQIGLASPRPEASAELILLAALARVQDPLLASLRKALDDVPATLRVALARGDAAQIRKFLDAPREASRADLFVERLLELRAAPPEAAAREIADLRGRAGKYGSAYDARSTVVRADAALWLAALAGPADRLAVESGVLRAWSETTSRVPAPDRFEMDSARAAGVQGRPVVGAIFAPLLLPER